MRDYAADYSEDDPYAEAETSRGFDGVQTLALIGAIALISAPVLQSFSRKWRARRSQPQLQSEPAIDKTLKDTYPASDPPASRYFDIPENRQ